MSVASPQTVLQPLENTTEEKKQMSVQANHTEGEIEIDLVDLSLFLLEKIHYIILCLMAGAVLFNAYAYFMIKPTYQSTAKLYIVSASNDAVVNLTDLNLGTSLTADYSELILSYPVLDQVIEKLELNMDYTALAKMVTLTNPKGTRMLNITVTATNRQQACDIANTLANVSVEYLPDTMSTRAPNVAQIARVARGKIAPSYMKYTVMGAAFGAVMYCVFLIIGYLMDDTVHTAEDVEKAFGIVPLTTIPENEKFRQDDGG